MTDSQRGPWTVVDDPGNCSMCGAHWDPGEQVRDDPDAGGLVCGACGQDDDEMPGIISQLLGDQEDASPQERLSQCFPSASGRGCTAPRLPVADGTLSPGGHTMTNRLLGIIMIEPGSPIDQALGHIARMIEKADSSAKAHTDILTTKAADPRPSMRLLVRALRDLSEEASFRADGLEKLLAVYDQHYG
jgi:hypothetical protein